MRKFKLYKSHFGNTSFILLDKCFCSSNELAQLLDIFNPQHLIVSITALYQGSDFFKFISNKENQFKIILPKDNAITSETIVESKTCDFLPVFDMLVESEPRCITLCNLKKSVEFDSLNYREFLNDEMLINKNIIDYSIAIILEECCIKITFNSNLYDSAHLFKAIKTKLK